MLLPLLHLLLSLLSTPQLLLLRMVCGMWYVASLGVVGLEVAWLNAVTVARYNQLIYVTMVK